MRDYKSGKWGFSLVWGLEASVFPRAVFLAAPNAVLAWLLSSYIYEDYRDEKAAKNAVSILAGFSSVLFFVLYFRSNIAYDRWWEGGTLLQKTRGEWFNAYSSLIAFSATDPEKQDTVEEFHHLLARLMSLLFCCGLQQVSPNRDRGFEIIDTTGIEQRSLQFLNESSDKVEVILQWIQRSTVLHMQTGVLPVAPPVLSRAFQEVSRGIVNLQNARKIADFPFPFPFAQTSMVMLLIHWAATPILCGQLLQRNLAAVVAFSVIFFIWCINYIALQLEQPFGSDANDLPMSLMQRDWNKSLGTLLAKRAQRPPSFDFDVHQHRKLEVAMSDGTTDSVKRRMTIARELGARPSGVRSEASSAFRGSCIPEGMLEEDKLDAAKPEEKAPPDKAPEAPVTAESKRPGASTELTDPIPQQVSETNPTKPVSPGRSPFPSPSRTQSIPAEASKDLLLDDNLVKFPASMIGAGGPSATPCEPKVQEAGVLSLLGQDRSRRDRVEEKHQAPMFPVAGAVDAAGFEQQLRMVGARMKELHGCLIDEELGLLSALGTRLVRPDARRRASGDPKKEQLLPVARDPGVDPGAKGPIVKAARVVGDEGGKQPPDEVNAI